MPEPIAYHSVVDLTHSLNDRSPSWEGTAESPFHTKETETLDRDGYYARVITTPEHYGTHLDAPAHFARGMWTVEQIPAERLVRPMVVLNVRNKASGHPDYEISVADIAEWEGQNGQIPSAAVVMVYTGWDERWNTPLAYRNADSDGTLHFPGYSSRPRNSW